LHAQKQQINIEDGKAASARTEGKKAAQIHNEIMKKAAVAVKKIGHLKIWREKKLQII